MCVYGHCFNCCHFSSPVNMNQFRIILCKFVFKIAFTINIFYRPFALCCACSVLCSVYTELLWEVMLH